MGGLLRCDDCGEVHWNLRLGGRSSAPAHCRVCGAELPAEPRRRFGRKRAEHTDLVPPDAPQVGPNPGS